MRLICKYLNGEKLNLSIKYKVGDYYYTKNDGTIVIIPKEFYERNKGKSYWEGIENAVNTANDSFKQTVEDDYKLSGYQNYRNFNSYLPEGYSFRNSGLIVSSDGTYYVPSFYKETNRIGVNREASPLQFTIYQGKPIEKQLTYYPVYDRKPLDTTNNTIKVLTEDDFEKQYAPVRDFKSGNINIIRYYAPTNPQADTSGYVYKQVLQEPEPLYDWDNYNEESFKIYSNQLDKWFNAYLKSLENIQKTEIPEGFNTITEQTFKTLYSNANEHNKNLVKAKYDNPALVLKGKTLPVKFFPNGYGDYKKAIYLPDGTNNVLSNGGKINNSFAKGGKLISKYQIGGPYKRDSHTGVIYLPHVSKIKSYDDSETSVLLNKSIFSLSGKSMEMDNKLLTELDDYLKSRNVGLPQRLAILYNVVQEGSTTKSHGNGAYGLLGWRGVRIPGKGINQMEYLYNTIFGKYNANHWKDGSSLQAFINAETVEDALNALTHGYVRPGLELREFRSKTKYFNENEKVN